MLNYSVAELRISRVCYLFGPHVAVKLDADFYLFPHGIWLSIEFRWLNISFLSNSVCSKTDNLFHKCFTRVMAMNWDFWGIITQKCPIKSRNIPIHMLMLKYKMLCVMTICR